MVGADSINMAQLRLVFKVVRFQSSPRETCSWQCGSGTWFSPGFNLPMLHPHLHLHVALTGRTNGAAWRHSKSKVLVEIAEHFHFSRP